MEGITAKNVIIDEVTAMRQKKCAQRPQGHTFTQDYFGVCSNCLLKITPEEAAKINSNHKSQYEEDQ